MIQDVPEEAVAAMYARAGRLGLPRSEYVRRTLATEMAAGLPVTAEDLSWFADRFSDLAEPDVMRQAWS